MQKVRELAREYLKQEKASQPEHFEAEAKVAAPKPSTTYGPLFKAAAVSSRFRIEELRADASDPGEEAELRNVSLTVRDRSGFGFRTLRADTRNAVLAQMSAQELAETLGKQPSESDPLRNALRRALGGLTTRDLTAMETAEIAALAQAYEGLSKSSCSRQARRSTASSSSRGFSSR